MGKRRPAASSSFDPATDARLRAVGDYEVVPDRGNCEIHFGPILAAAGGLPGFAVSWFVTGPGRDCPVPGDGLFDLWERYRTAHTELCTAYRALLFGLFARSRQAAYTDQQWRLIRRTRPTEQDMRSVISSAEVRLEQSQEKGAAAPAFEAQVAFAVFWDEHGVAVRLRESGRGFTLGEWSGIGDL